MSEQLHTNGSAAPQGPLPTPPDFPVTWENPADAEIFWTHDPMHQPAPMPPLAFAFSRITAEGWTKGFRSYGIPVTSRAIHVNYYQYDASVPDRLSPTEMEANGKLVQDRVGAVMARLQEAWETEWLPAIKTELAAWEEFDLAGAALPQLSDHFEETLERHLRLWDLHFRIVPPMMLPISLLDDLYQDLFGDENRFGAYELLEGLDNMTVASGRELWALSRKALADPEVREIMTTGDGAEVMARLGHSAAGRAFREEFEVYLQVYGLRGDSWGVHFPAWIEDPTPLLKNLRDYMAQPDRDIDQELKDSAARREARVAAVRERLKGYPAQVAGQFEFLLKAAQAGNVLSEDHGYWIDFRAAAMVRRVLLEVGRRLAAAGTVERPDDILFLHVDEVRASIANGSGPDQRGLVAKRRAELAHFAQIEPPHALGTPPPGPPPDNPFVRVLGKFFGLPPAPSETPGVFNGAAGSAGVVSGRARVVKSLAEAAAVQAGEVLVAPTTAPPWTPLFATVAGVVTDTGGILSHCAVVAREYGIPAVVGTGAASKMIRTGQLIEVDGNAGTVRVLD